MVFFQKHAPFVGSLQDLSKHRAAVVDAIVQHTTQEYDPLVVKELLLESAYWELLQGASSYYKTSSSSDQGLKFWSHVQRTIMKKECLPQEQRLFLQSGIRYYAQQVLGDFSPWMYKFATKVIPWGFDMLLHAWGGGLLGKSSLSQRFRIEGSYQHLQALSQKGSLVFLPTHQSNLDSLILGFAVYLMGLPPCAYGAGLNLYKNPIMRLFLKKLGAYSVARDKPQGLYKTTLKHISMFFLTQGIHSIFFPGGSRSRSGAIEEKLKLGLLGTAVGAQVELLRNAEQHKIFIVPVVLSTHFVLEASGLIQNYLMGQGQYRYFGEDVPASWWQSLQFIRRIIASETTIVMRLGDVLDVCGNKVDETGRSVMSSGRVIPYEKWFYSKGAIVRDTMRDKEFTKHLGGVVLDQFHQHHTVLSSQAVAFGVFQIFRQRYERLDLFALLLLSEEQKTVLLEDFLKYAVQMHAVLLDKHAKGELFCEQVFFSAEAKRGLPLWVVEGVQHLACAHHQPIVVLSELSMKVNDMQLLYYYRNRLTDFGLEYPSVRGKYGVMDEQGFLVG